MASNPAHTEVAAFMQFDSIRYSQVWEDAQRLRAALNIAAHECVLSIGSAGCNVLALLLDAPRRIHAVDLNAAQNAITALKIAAISKLDHPSLLELLGFVPSSRRLALLDQLLPYLTPAFAAYWQEQSPLISEGLLGSGRLDRFIANFARETFAHIPGILDLKPAFASLDMERQRQFRAALQKGTFAQKFSTYFGSELMHKGRDPAQYRYVTIDDLGRELLSRFYAFLENKSLQGNHYQWFFLFGEPMPAAQGPYYAQADNWQRLRELVPRVELHTKTIEALLESEHTGPIDKANLSNIFEYMSEENMAVLLRQLATKMPRGGRIAYWNLFVDRPLPKALRTVFQNLEPPPYDRVWFYQSFHLLERL